jgi:glycerol-3-phosphate acyltransferase PlsY
LLSFSVNNNLFRIVVLPFLLAGAVGYLLGSFPTAYLLVRWKSDLDIRKHGSGNVGTLNSFEVTDSKAVGVGVLLIDLVKGVLSVLIVGGFISNDFPILATGGIGAVLGHNFPVWLGFKGGRGLATAAGVMLLLGWAFVPLWMFAWFVGKLISKDVNIGNAVGTLAILAVALLVPAQVLAGLIPENAATDEFRWYVVVLAFLILVRLAAPVREYVANRRNKQDVQQ